MYYTCDKALLINLVDLADLQDDDLDELKFSVGSWPELVGKDGLTAKSAIQKATGLNTRVIITPENSMVTMDYRLDRVRIYVDSNGIVTRVPRRG